ncbi:metallophosphoesterase [Chitinophaga nivalis]|uniref:Metallophosphoesterase n=1 Tax=Chitinophaga nivalis TaxID=2991709 RepID=A0ABT3IP66_9BACT|nr:metallophosphoesterase [Chitinophaga nivalis]MCW3464545.1 metallophosphoesterase [Chitinophaga nivalis]MCW3485764.1 metallophosphoesterase [Chitinophaga nivalis]
MNPQLKKLFAILAFSAGPVLTTVAQTTLLPFGSSWKYLDNGSNQGTSWRAVSFNDGSWKSGPGKLGYGDGDEATVVSYGSSSSSKYVTTYFRKTFNITGVNNYNNFILEYLRDDGIVIYVNGTEVKRDNISSGTVSYTTLASDASDDGDDIQTATLNAGNFVEGSNTIAVEIHQSDKSSSDISFDLQVKGSSSSNLPVISRGPYLQMGNQTAVSVRWRTGIAANGKVKYGTVLGNLTDSVVHTDVVTEHEVRITGLQPDTKYYYSVGTSAGVIEAGEKNYFNTAPLTNTPRKIRIAAYGDCGNNSTNQKNVRDAYLNYVGANHTDVWLLLGDNAYDDGKDAEFQTNFFNIYKDNLLKNILLFPSPGNHDYDNNSTRQDDHNIPYLANFSLPKNGECGGLASGKEEYYSFDYGDIHFISLDSYGKESSKRFYDTSSAQVIWLKKDLAANTRKWTIAYWHHPPYTMGSHNSDSESELVSVRKNLIRILERYGVDLILNGHSHDYERSFLIHGHFGLENTFSFSQHALSNSSAKYDGSANSCPYVTTSAKTDHGTIYVVAGSAGQVGGTSSSFPHAISYYANATTGGSLVLEVEGSRLDAKFVAADKTIKDQFTIVKDANKKTTLPVTPGQPLTLTASWIGKYQWNTGATTRSITVTPSAGTTVFTVTDNATASGQCLRDTFNVVAASPLAEMQNISEAKNGAASFSYRAYPNPASGNTFQLEINSWKEQPLRLLITDLNGKEVQHKTWGVPSGISKQTVSLPQGVYFITLTNTKGEKQTEKIMMQ